MQYRIHKQSFGLVFISALFFINISCSFKKSSDVYGTYRLQLADSLKNPHFPLQEAFLIIKDDKTIIYTSTINNKPKFHFLGTYNFEEKTNSLQIKWQSGKLPSKLNIEKVADDYIIRIGNSNYYKEKS